MHYRERVETQPKYEYKNQRTKFFNFHPRPTDRPDFTCLPGGRWRPGCRRAYRRGSVGPCKLSPAVSARCGIVEWSLPGRSAGDPAPFGGTNELVGLAVSCSSGSRGGWGCSACIGRRSCCASWNAARRTKDFKICSQFLIFDQKIHDKKNQITHSCKCYINE